MALHQVDGVVGQPAAPAGRNDFAGFQIEGQAETIGRFGIRIIGGRHAQVHQTVHFGTGRGLLVPHGF